MIHLFAWAAVLSLALLLMYLCGIMLQIRRDPSQPTRWAQSNRLVLPTESEREQAEKAAGVLYTRKVPRNRSQLPQDESEVIRIAPVPEN